MHNGTPDATANAAAVQTATAMALECSITLTELCRVFAIAQPVLASAVADRLGFMSSALLTTVMPDDGLREIHRLTAEMLNNRQAELAPK